MELIENSIDFYGLHKALLNQQIEFSFVLLTNVILLVAIFIKRL